MSTSSVKTDNSTLSRLDQVWLKLESFMNLLAGFTIFLLVGLAVVHVVSRKLLNAPVPGYVDWTQQFMAVFAFLGLSFCQREGG
ncbi:MAG: TRAP transporter small permease, partial [Paracoccaceae bacterium]|nr:TRAP transporter small permease [Paracoccaceae bacterium]